MKEKVRFKNALVTTPGVEVDGVGGFIDGHVTGSLASNNNGTPAHGCPSSNNCARVGGCNLLKQSHQVSFFITPRNLKLLQWRPIQMERFNQMRMAYFTTILFL